MNAIFNDFRDAYKEGSGYKLSMTLFPVAPPSDPDRLRSFFNSTNYSAAKDDIMDRLLETSIRFGEDEGNGWVELYFAYWKAVGEILKAEKAVKEGSKVC